jgi:hypothetical protein
MSAKASSPEGAFSFPFFFYFVLFALLSFPFLMIENIAICSVCLLAEERWEVSDQDDESVAGSWPLLQLRVKVLKKGVCIVSSPPV